MENIVRTNKLRIKAKNAADIKQSSIWSKPLLTSYARSDKKTFSFIMTEANKALRFFSEGVVIYTFDVFF